MKVSGTMLVTCPKCGADPDLEKLRGQLKSSQQFRCDRCGTVSARSEAFQVLTVGARLVN